MKTKQNGLLGNLSFKIVLAVITFLLSLYFFALMAHEAFLRQEDQLDRAVFAFFASHVPDGYYRLTRFFTFLGTPDFLLPVYVLLLTYFLLTKQKEYAIEFGVLGTTSTGLLFGLKAVFARSRPQLPIFEHLPGYSFPSGHALLSFILCSFLTYWLWNSNSSKTWKWTATVLLLLFAFCQGISRIILRVHYATDVIAGFCLGYAWVFISLWVQKRWKQR